jgi:hypothetical protein
MNLSLALVCPLLGSVVASTLAAEKNAPISGVAISAVAKERTEGVCWRGIPEKNWRLKPERVSAAKKIGPFNNNPCSRTLYIPLPTDKIVAPITW